MAGTLPGHGGTTSPRDLSIENHARPTCEAADLRATAVVGFSIGANVALEMVACGSFTGPVVLLAPCFSRRDEATFIRGLDRLALVLGPRPFAAMLKIIGPAMKSNAGQLTPDRFEALVTELRHNDPHVMGQMFHQYLRYLDRHGSVASRLCDPTARRSSSG